MKTESQKIYVSSKYLAAPTQLTRLTVTNVNAFASQTISEIHKLAAVESATWWWIVPLINIVMKIIDVEIPALEQVVLTTLCVPLSITKQSVFVQNHQPGTHMMNALPLLKVRIRAFLMDSSTMVEW